MPNLLDIRFLWHVKFLITQSDKKKHKLKILRTSYGRIVGQVDYIPAKAKRQSSVAKNYANTKIAKNATQCITASFQIQTQSQAEIAVAHNAAARVRESETRRERETE